MGGTIIVTGGSRGIGAAVCRRLAAAGHAVVVNYAGNRGAAETVAEAIRAGGGQALAAAGDVADPAQARALFAQAESLGPLAGLVNNAGISGTLTRVDEMPPEQMQRLFAVNVFGSMNCAAEAVRRLSTKHGGPGGAIVNLSSVAARLGGAGGLATYAASKGAIESFTKGLASEVAKEGIRVNAVAPGVIETDMAGPALREMARTVTPLGRAGQAEEVAEAVAWLMSPAASYVTGVVLTVAGGR